MRDRQAGQRRQNELSICASAVSIDQKVDNAARPGRFRAAFKQYMLSTDPVALEIGDPDSEREKVMPRIECMR